MVCRQRSQTYFSICQGRLNQERKQLMTLKEQIIIELEPIESEDALAAILDMVKSCKKDQPKNSLWGFFYDDADLIDEIVSDAMNDRANRKFRTSDE